MKIGRKKETMNLKLGSNEVEQVSKFTYLGTIFSEDGKLDAEIQSRTNKANAVGFQLSRCFFNKKEVSERTKLVVYNSIFRPVLTYGCESWIRNRSIDQRLETTDMRVLRRISGVNRWLQ